MKRFIGLAILLMIGLTCLPALALAFPGNVDLWKTNNLKRLPNGYFEPTGGDPYIVFPAIDQCKCKLKQVQFQIDFDPMPTKPFFMEFFWSTDMEGFSESKKVFFILFPNAESNLIDFTIPLTEVLPYTQTISNTVHTLRIDFPKETKTIFKIKNVRLHASHGPVANSLNIVPFYTLMPYHASDPAILSAHILTTIQHGLKKLGRDPLFVIAWLLLMGALLFLLRRIKLHS